MLISIETSEVDNMATDRTSVYAYILSTLKNESMDEFARHGQYAKIKAERDPLKPWLAVMLTHQMLMTSKVAAAVKKSAREEYYACKQGVYELIVDYKRRLDATLETYIPGGSTTIPEEDIAMDFMYGLDNNICKV
jgi:hypothetical protein